jgi:hypothetical protein
MYAWAARRRTGCESGQVHESMEGVLDVAVEQPGPGQGDKERRRAGSGGPVAQHRVAA